MLDRSFLPGESALMVPKTDDGRVLFAIPWHDRVICRHDGHADRDSPDRAQAARGGVRISARTCRALPQQAAAASGHPEHVRGSAAAAPRP